MDANIRSLLVVLFSPRTSEDRRAKALVLLKALLDYMPESRIAREIHRIEKRNLLTGPKLRIIELLLEHEAHLLAEKNPENQKLQNFFRILEEERKRKRTS